MSDYIPFDIQSDIIKRLPVKSLIQFRSVSKRWRSFIDNPKFINTYHINHTNPKHHLFVSYELDAVKTYTSIVDNNTFPQQKFPLTPPDSLRLLRHAFLLNSVNGLLCFCNRYGDVHTNTRTVVIWNPTVRKSVGIVIPVPEDEDIFVGFGVCPVTSHSKLVKITVDKTNSTMWVFVDGVIYFRAYDDESMNRGSMLNFLISFDLKSEKFGDVCLPDKLVHTHNHLDVAKVNESLGLLEYCELGDVAVCGVWSRNDGGDKPFTKIYTVKVEGKWLYDRVLGFRNNGEVVIELMDDDNVEESSIEVYEPLSGHTIGVGINGKGMFFARSYMETLLLLDESDSIIH